MGDISYEEYERRVRERAYQLWEAAGQPDGDSDHFWYDAQHQFDAEHPELAILHGNQQHPDSGQAESFVVQHG